MLVAIEGMDGVGKTTVAKRIEKDLNFIYVKDPLKDLFELDDGHLEKVSDKVFGLKNDKLISWYLGLGDSYALSHYKGNDVVMDRHILLNYFWNGNRDTEKVFDVQIELFGKPDLTILLVASSDIRRKRIESRDCNDPDLNKDKIFEYGYDKMISFLDKYHYNYVIVDTDGMSSLEMIEKCKSLIEQYR